MLYCCFTAALLLLYCRCKCSGNSCTTSMSQGHSGGLNALACHPTAQVLLCCSWCMPCCSSSLNAPGCHFRSLLLYYCFTAAVLLQIALSSGRDGVLRVTLYYCCLTTALLLLYYRSPSAAGETVCYGLHFTTAVLLLLYCFFATDRLQRRARRGATGHRSPHASHAAQVELLYCCFTAALLLLKLKVSALLMRRTLHGY